MHDLERIRQDLQVSLSLDKHPVALLIGAGCPVAVRVKNQTGNIVPLIPDIRGLTSTVREELKEDQYFKIILKQFIDDGRSDPTVEDVLSHVRLLARVAGNGKVRGLMAAELRALEKRISIKIVGVVRRDLPTDRTPYGDLADWIGGISRSKGLQVFTTNYDLLIEQALESRSLPYFDGFVGSNRPSFDLRAIEEDPLPSRWTRLWKLHGSVNWRLESSGSVVRTSCQHDEEGGMLIHPSELKYEQSRRMPYLAMIDRLRAFLRQPSAFLLTTGYSYADEHLNEVILQGMTANSTAAAFGLLYQPLENETGALRITPRIPRNLTLLARDQGVVKGVRGAWLSKPDSDQPMKCALGDFAEFASFTRSLCLDGGGSEHA